MDSNESFHLLRSDIKCFYWAFELPEFATQNYSLKQKDPQCLSDWGN